MTTMEELCEHARRREWLLSYDDLFERRWAFMRTPGVYIWYFCKQPGTCPAKGCIKVATGVFPFRTHWNMLYIGRAGAEGLASRVIDWHFGNKPSAGPSLSTLRETLAVLKGYQILEIKPGRYRLSPENERKLTAWMRRYGRVLVHPTERYSEVESHLINHFNPPLNIAGCNNDFVSKLKKLRSSARERARHRDV